MIILPKKSKLKISTSDNQHPRSSDVFSKPEIQLNSTNLLKNKLQSLHGSPLVLKKDKN